MTVSLKNYSTTMMKTTTVSLLACGEQAFSTRHRRPRHITNIVTIVGRQKITDPYESVKKLPERLTRQFPLEPLRKFSSSKAVAASGGYGRHNLLVRCQDVSVLSFGQPAVKSLHTVFTPLDAILVSGLSEAKTAVAKTEIPFQGASLARANFRSSNELSYLDVHYGAFLPVSYSIP